MALTKRTPCVGICSTTYGDLVCRGCKRFAHEIIAWNGYDDSQRQQVWSRLNGLRDQVVAQHVRLDSRDQFKAYCLQAGLTDALTRYLEEPAAQAEVVYQVLLHLVTTSAPLVDAGLGSAADPQGPAPTSLSLIQAVDAEIFSRSTAHYERNFKVTS